MNLLGVSEGHWHRYGRGCARLTAAAACAGPKLKLGLGMVRDV